MDFEWDDRKALSNISKHGVTFGEAQTAFLDPNRREFYRPRHGEDRFVMIAGSGANLLYVVYVERDGKIRIISARKANASEKKAYRGGRRQR